MMFGKAFVVNCPAQMTRLPSPVMCRLSCCSPPTAAAVAVMPHTNALMKFIGLNTKASKQAAAASTQEDRESGVKMCCSTEQNERQLKRLNEKPQA